MCLMLVNVAGFAPTTTQTENSFSADGSETKTATAAWKWSSGKGVEPPKQVDPNYNPDVPPIGQQP